MKKTVPCKKVLPNLSSSLLVALFTIPALSSTEASSIKSKTLQPDHTDTIVISKLSENKNYTIQMSTNAVLHQLVISAGPEQKKTYRFYMFDIDGNLKAEATILSNQKTSLVNIPKGNYVFEILSDDERIENGELTVK